MLPLIDADSDKAIETANGIVVGFAGIFQTAWLAGMRAKIGLFDAAAEGDLDLVQALLTAMEAGEADFTRTFRRSAPRQSIRPPMPRCVRNLPIRPL